RFLHFFLLFFFTATATTEIYTLSLHDALPIFEFYFRGKIIFSPNIHGLDYTDTVTGFSKKFLKSWTLTVDLRSQTDTRIACDTRSEEHTSELQSLAYLVCRLLLEKKKNIKKKK